MRIGRTLRIIDWRWKEEMSETVSYAELLERLLVMEYNKSPERAKELVRNNHGIVIQGMMAGNQSLRACAMLLDDEDVKGCE